MSSFRAFLVLFTAALSLAFSSPASADAGPGKCTGQFVNPITDICWSCLFPISIGGLEIWPSNRPDPDNPDLPVCLCGLRSGIAMGFWEPVRLADVSMKPWCFVNLGGMKLDPGFDIGFRSISGPSAVGGASQYYSSWHVYPPMREAVTLFRSTAVGALWLAALILAPLFLLFWWVAERFGERSKQKKHVRGAELATLSELKREIERHNRDARSREYGETMGWKWRLAGST